MTDSQHTLGCGDSIQPESVHVETGQPHYRDLSNIRVDCLEFPFQPPVTPAALAQVFSGMDRSEAIAFEVLGLKHGITVQLISQKRQRAPLLTRVRSTLDGVTVSEVAPSLEPLSVFIQQCRRVPRVARPKFIFRNYYLPRPWFMPLGPTLEDLGSIFATLNLVNQQRHNGLGLYQVLFCPVSEPYLRNLAADLEQNKRRTRRSQSTGNIVEYQDPKLSRYESLVRTKGERGFLFAVCLRTAAFGYYGLAESVVLGLHNTISSYLRSHDNKTFFYHNQDTCHDHGFDWEDQILSLLHRTTHTRGMFLALDELATLLPTPSPTILQDTTYKFPRAAKTRPVPEMFTSKKDPHSNATGSALSIGTNVHQGVERDVYLPWSVRNIHVYLIGGSGAGKTTAMRNMIRDDLAAGRGLAVISPQEDLTQHVLALIPEHRERDLVYFNAADPDNAVGFNVLHSSVTANPIKRRNDIIQILERLFQSGLGDRMRRLLGQCLDLLIAVPGTSLVDLPALLTHAGFRKSLLEQLRGETDYDRQLLLEYWQSDYPALQAKLGASIDACIDRVQYITGNSVLRDLLCQRENTLDIAQIIAEKKVFVCNLGANSLGSDAYFLANFLNSEFQIAGMGRPVDVGPDFYLYVDEFQNYTEGGFEKILTEGRKFRISLVMAHQYISQIDNSKLVSALLSIPSMVVFRSEAKDAAVIARGLDLTVADIVTLPKYHAWVKVDQHYFTLATHKPPEPIRTEAEVRAMIDESNARYTNPKAQIRYDLYPWAGADRRRKKPKPKPTGTTPESFDMTHDEI